MTNEKNSKKKIINVLLFCFIILFIYRAGQIPRHIYRYVDIEMGSGVDRDGADGADGADHNKK